MAENERLPRKQRYTGYRICKDVQVKGYGGAESTVRGYITQRRPEKKKTKVYIPLEFDPGTDAQVDWGEAIAVIGGKRLTAQIFLMRAYCGACLGPIPMDAVRSIRATPTTCSDGMPTTFPTLSESLADIVRIQWTAWSES